MNRRRPQALAFRVGASPPVVPPPPPTPPNNSANQDVTLDELRKALRPTVIVIAVLTGAAFAIGSGLVSRYLFKH